MENFKKLVKSQGEEKRQVKDYEIVFGKHKGKTFEYVYNNDIKYVGWLLDNLEEQKNNVLVKYFRDRINKDFCDENVEETIDRLGLDELGLLPPNPPKLERSKNIIKFE